VSERKGDDKIEKGTAKGFVIEGVVDTYIRRHEVQLEVNPALKR